MIVKLIIYRQLPLPARSVGENVNFRIQIHKTPIFIFAKILILAHFYVDIGMGILTLIFRARDFEKVSGLSGLRFRSIPNFYYSYVTITCIRETMQWIVLVHIFFVRGLIPETSVPKFLSGFLYHFFCTLQTCKNTFGTNR